MKNNINIKLS